MQSRERNSSRSPFHVGSSAENAISNQPRQRSFAEHLRWMGWRGFPKNAEPLPMRRGTELFMSAQVPKRHIQFPCMRNKSFPFTQSSPF